MVAQPNLAAAHALVQRLPPSPAEKPLFELVRWVIENDPDYAGLSEKQIFEKAGYDPREAAGVYKQACKTSENRLVRFFCMERISKLTQTFMPTGRAVGAFDYAPDIDANRPPV